jgi:hypothetical protein
MEHAAPTSAASPQDPLQDRPQDRRVRPVPNNIEVLLHAVGVLLTYGRHLIDTVRQRATAPNFNAIAACFGTSNLSTIVAHLNRGLLRAAALERLLLARAATGRDIDVIKRHTWTTLEPGADPAEDTQPEQPVAQPPSPHKRASRPSRPVGWDDPELFMPTLQELERQVRRHPIGRTILHICLDLGVVPGFCHSAFWNELFELITHFGSNVSKVMEEKTRRRRAFANEQDRNPKASWDWLNLSRDAPRQILGFFIGEPPVNPLDPAAAIATGPP